ncbi:hypothetical protein [Chitinimonas lacunae]|uniref:Uncharacterized protein n=1 Tax=Chitinimonas lacunae TaxID=1963018 RepID=A0ABV8MUY2_9NEIS
MSAPLSLLRRLLLACPLLLSLLPAQAQDFYQTYVFARVPPSQGENERIYRYTQRDGWQPYDGLASEYAHGIVYEPPFFQLLSLLPPALQQRPGTRFYLGYGTDEFEMISHCRLARFFVLPDQNGEIPTAPRLAPLCAETE